MLVKPFKGLCPTPKTAQQVVAPPYDVMSRAEALQMAQDKPLSFLHISRPEIDLPLEVGPYESQVYQTGKANLTKLVDQGVLLRDSTPCYYICRMEDGDHHQTGLVAVCSVEAYRQNRIKKHELTRPEKENDRIRHIDCLNAQSSPVLLASKPSQTFSALLKKHSAKAPWLDVRSDRNTRHSLWKIDQPQEIEAITRLFGGEQEGGLDVLYIADGHHRSAAASRVAEMRTEQDPKATKDAPYQHFLSVIYPSDQMLILDYNRIIKDLHGLSEKELLDGISEHFEIEPSKDAVKPSVVGEMGIYLASGWHRLSLKKQLLQNGDTPALDVERLYMFVLKPLLGIVDQRTDPRIDFVGGIRGLQELEKRVDSKEMAVAFSMYPTQIEQIFEIADADKVMPPKSTWFEPKLVDGLVAHLFDD